MAAVLPINKSRGRRTEHRPLFESLFLPQSQTALHLHISMGALRSTSAITTSNPAGQKNTAAAMAVESVSADEACALLASGQHGYIDVRMWEDFDAGHVDGARNVPYYLSVAPRGRPKKNGCFVKQVGSLHGKDDHILVGCRQGVRSRLATADLVQAGFKNVKNVEGGYLSLLKSTNPQPAAYHQEPTTSYLSGISMSC